LDLRCEVIELTGAAEFIQIENVGADGDAEVRGLTAGDGTVG
jgi:hypothetical protein